MNQQTSTKIDDHGTFVRFWGRHYKTHVVTAQMMADFPEDFEADDLGKRCIVLEGRYAVIKTDPKPFD